VAEEKGYFKDEGLDYEFVHGMATVQPAVQEGSVQQVKDGAFESYERGRDVEVSSACHWTVNMASSAGHGRMWGHAYSITPAGIFVPPESSIRTAADLKNVEISVGYHSGSHFSSLMALEKFLPPEQIKLQFVGGPNSRLELLLQKRVEAAQVFSSQYYVIEQQGYRKVVDASFMIGFLFSVNSDVEEVAKYFNALRRAQRDIDLDLSRYKHYYLRELPEQYHRIVDVQAFGPGERLVFEPYTREMYEETHRWIEERQLFPESTTPAPEYAEVVAAG
jgi:ABC-type nitrate/sulfonate/bicarbonate transport system substrate-binding protein